MTNITEGPGVNLIDQRGRSLGPTKLENLILNSLATRWTIRADQPNVEIVADLGTLAAEIEKAYILIPRADLPKTDVIKQAGRDMVDVDGADSLWHVAQDPANLRRWACEYLAAAEAITAHQSSAKAAEAEDARRLDEEADKLRLALYGTDGDATDHVPWLNLATSRQDKYRRAARKARELHQPKS